MRKIAFIGLGNMGQPMAAHFAAAGLALTVHSRTRAKADELLSAGATWRDSLAAAAREAEAVITMVGGPEDVAAVYRGGILDHAPPGALLIDMTTSSPRLAAELHAEARTRGLRLLDAPVTGGVAGARAAALTIFAGGDEPDFAAARPLLDRLGQRIVHCGPAGSGQRLKLTNQTIVAGTVLGLAEGLALGAYGALDLKRLVPALGGGTAGGFLFQAYAEKMIGGDFAASFTIDHFVKDLRLAAAEAESLGLDLAVLRAAAAQFERLARTGSGEKGIQAIAARYGLGGR